MNKRILGILVVVALGFLVATEVAKRRNLSNPTPTTPETARRENLNPPPSLSTIEPPRIANEQPEDMLIIAAEPSGPATPTEPLFENVQTFDDQPTEAELLEIAPDGEVAPMVVETRLPSESRNNVMQSSATPPKATKTAKPPKLPTKSNNNQKPPIPKLELIAKSSNVAPKTTTSKPTRSKVTPNQAPRPTSVASNNASRTQAPAKKERWAVQVGSFASQSNAQTLHTKLKQAGYPSYIEKISSQYRVRIGPYVQQNDAIRIKQVLATGRQSSTIVVIP